MKKVLIPTKLDRIARDILTANGNYTVIQDEMIQLEAVPEEHCDAYALIVRSEAVTAKVIDRLPQLKVIIRAGAGFNTIDTKYARKRGVDVMTTPGANSNGVAEEVIAMILADARHIVAADASTRRGEWEKKKFVGRELAGKTVGVFGLGNIGRLVARRLEGFECRLLGFDPMISVERAQEMSVELVDLKTLFSQSDYITLHIPENDETRGIINRDLLSIMKPGATIVNCARAGVINENDLRSIKAEKQLRFLNDVYAKDVEGKKSVEDIADIMLPHLGASTREANANAARRAAEELIELDYKGVTSYIVNRDIPDGLDEEYCELAFIVARLCQCLIGKNVTPKMIESSFYGQLEQYANWLLVPIIAGVWDSFDRSKDYGAAKRYLDEMGIEYINRKTDPGKGFENSITVDLTSAVNTDNLRRISVRGTVAEGIPMIARINEFDKLYFEPAGHIVFFIYADRPGVLGAIGQHLASAGVNIEDVRNPHDAKTNRSLAIMRTNVVVSETLMNQISGEIKALSAFSISL